MDRKRKSGSDMGELPAELQHDGPKCTCAYAHKPENADTGSGDSEGGAARDLVGQEHNGNRRAADSRIRNDSGKVRQHHRHPHRLDRNRGDELREAGVEVVSHRYYGVSPRPSLEHIAEERVKTNFDNKVTHKVSTSGDVLFPFISRNPLFAKLVPVFASAPNSETQAGGSLDDNMELVIGTRKHKSSGSHKHHGEGSPKKHHHHRHRSEGDIEKDRVRPKSKRDEDELRESKDKVELAGRSRSDDRGKEKSVLSSSSSREKEKPIPSSSSSREREKPIASSSSSREKEKHRSKSPTSTERARHGESDKQREERRRKKKERSQEDKDKHSVGDKQKERPQDAASFAAGLASLDAKDKKKENKSKRRYRESVADTTLADVLVIRGGGESPGWRTGLSFKPLDLTTLSKGSSSDRHSITSFSSGLKHGPHSKSSQKSHIKPNDKDNIKPILRINSNPEPKAKEWPGRTEKPKSKDKDTTVVKGKPSFLGFILEKNEKQVECVSCRSDDTPRHLAAKLPCNHYFCHDCLKRIFHLSLKDPAHMPPRCCTAEHIPLKHVDRLLTYQTKKLWNRKFAEYSTANRIYCPTRDCGEWIPPRDIMGKVGFCSRCNVKVCIMCNGKAHKSKDCPKDEDLKVFIRTARENSYQKCYSCKTFVELEQGCNHITCRCQAQFCYACGEKWKGCECPWFTFPAVESDDEDMDAEMVQRRNRRREQRERGEQLVQDEAFARRLAQAQTAIEEEVIDDDLKTQLTSATAFGSLRSGLRNSYKKLSEEYAEVSKRDEAAREERVKERLQKLRERDDAIKSARRNSSSNREPRPPVERRSRRNSEPRVSRRSSPVRPRQIPEAAPVVEEIHATPSTPRSIFNDERAERVARYIRGEISDEEFFGAQATSPVETAQQVEKPVGAAMESPVMTAQKGGSVRSRRNTVSSTTRPGTSAGESSRTSARSATATRPSTCAGPTPTTQPAYNAPETASKLKQNDTPTTPSRRESRSTPEASTSDLRKPNPQQSSKPASCSSERPSTSYERPHTSYERPSTSYNYSMRNQVPSEADRERVREFTQKWGGMEKLGGRWKEAFVEKVEVTESGRIMLPRRY